MNRISIHHYGRFVLGIVLGISTLIGLWIGADYPLSQTTEELVLRIAAVMYSGALYGIVTYFLVVYVVRPIFLKKSRTAEPHYFLAGLSVTLSLITLVLAIIDPTTIPFLGGMR